MEGVWGIYVGYRWALYHKRVKHIVCVPKNQNWSKNMENPKIVENVNFIFLKFMTFWKKFYQYFPYFGQLWRNELLLTKIGPVPTNLLTKSENVRVWKLFFIKIYHQKINSRGQQDQNGVYWALSQLTQRTTGLMKSWPPHSGALSTNYPTWNKSPLRQGLSSKTPVLLVPIFLFQCSEKEVSFSWLSRKFY